jgi:branched-chain amino acid transport system substrate-binding protein
MNMTAILHCGKMSFPTSKEPIKLGAVLPLGDVSGNQSAKAMRAAVWEINMAGGVLDRPIDLIVEDCAGNPKFGLTAIEKLAELDKVDMFVVGVNSGVHETQQDYQTPVLREV